MLRSRRIAADRSILDRAGTNWIEALSYNFVSFWPAPLHDWVRTNLPQAIPHSDQIDQAAKSQFKSEWAEIHLGRVRLEALPAEIRRFLSNRWLKRRPRGK